MLRGGAMQSVSLNPWPTRAAAYHLRMAAHPIVHTTLAEMAHAARQALAGWWGIVRLAAMLLEMLLTPATYSGENWRLLARHLVQDAAPMLAWFTVLTTLMSLIVIRIVVVTALSYGLTQYALEMVVRVLVLELIPLSAALFAALRCTLPNAAEVLALRAQGQWEAQRRKGRDPLQAEVLPRIASGVFSALLLAAVSCAVTLVLAYLAVYGPAAAGLADYTRTVGHVFNAAVSLILALKIVFFSVAVSLVPMAAVLGERPLRRREASAELQGLVRMFIVILLIEAASLVGNYY
jgi:phospholipid/cholesterol/gamma-HCH transport system permease protein